MFKKWIEDIRVKTKNMDRKGTIEYIAAYYWYHILTAAIVLVLISITVYHLAWGRQKKSFTLAIVNQQIDYERDERLLNQFSESSGIKSRKLSVDSDYLFSYGDIKLEGVNENSFEKFFLGWSSGFIDAAVIPESLYRYCISQDGVFTGLEEICPDILQKDNEERERREACLYIDDGKYTGIYIEKTKFAKDFIIDSSDPAILVFLENNNSHMAQCRKFIKFVLAE